MCNYRNLSLIIDLHLMAGNVINNLIANARRLVLIRTLRVMD